MVSGEAKGGVIFRFAKYNNLGLIKAQQWGVFLAHRAKGWDNTSPELLGNFAPKKGVPKMNPPLYKGKLYLLPPGKRLILWASTPREGGTPL